MTPARLLKPGLPRHCPLALEHGLHVQRAGNLLEQALAVLDAEHHAALRYLLTCIWDIDRPLAVWIMLNPSTATAIVKDPTFRRCQDFTERWNLPGIGLLGGMIILNLFAYRATKPQVLRTVADPVGEHADRFLAHYTSPDVTRGGPVIAAWGNHGSIGGRSTQVRATLQDAGVQVHCLAVNKSGEPKHPLYVHGATQPTPLPLAS